MSQLKKYVQTPYFAATAGAALIAVALAPAFDRSRGIANGQIPTNAQPTTAVSAVPANPNPLGIGASSPLGTSAVPTTNPTEPAAFGTPNQPTTADAGNLETLRSRARQLQENLRRVPTTAEDQDAQRQTVAELSALQMQIQQLEANAGQFASYRQARDAQNPNAAGFDGLPNANGGVGFNGLPGANGANPFDRQGALDASGLNGSGLGGAAFANVPVSALQPGEAEVLRQQKEALTQQFRQLQQTSRALQPGDEALANDLKQEQTSLLNQLKEIETRLAAAPAANASVNSALLSANDPSLGGLLPTGNQLPNAGPDAGTDVAAKMQKATQAAELLRDAGLVGLANCVSNEVPRLAASDFVETQYVPGAWAEGAGLAEERSNPFQQVSAEEVKAIHTSIDDLKTKVDSLSATLENVETQLKLLTRQTVDSAATPAANPTVAPTDPTAPDATSDAANADGSTPKNAASENETNAEIDALGGSL